MCIEQIPLIINLMINENMKFLYNQVNSEKYTNHQSQRLNVFQVESNAVSFTYGS